MLKKKKENFKKAGWKLGEMVLEVSVYNHEQTRPKYLQSLVKEEFNGSPSNKPFNLGLWFSICTPMWLLLHQYYYNCVCVGGCYPLIIIPFNYKSY